MTPAPIINPSDELTRVLKWLEPHLGDPAVQMNDETFRLLYQSLLGIRNDVRALENHWALKPRPCPSPPWFDPATAANVVSINVMRGKQS